MATATVSHSTARRAPVVLRLRLGAPAIGLRIDWPLLAVVALAALLRLACLDAQPPHQDEAVNASFATHVLAEGRYAYDLANFHGPLPFYLWSLAQWLGGASLWTLRLPAALASLACVLLMAAFARFIGRPAALWAAACMAVSPAFIYYGREIIHESFLVAATLLAAWGALGLVRDGRWSDAAALAVGLAAMALIKETWILAAAAMAWSMAVCGRLGPGPGTRELSAGKLAAALAAAALLIAAGYTAGFRWPDDLVHVTQAMPAWAKTGWAASGHEKPWWYWIALAAKYEWPVLLGWLIAAVGLLSLAHLRWSSGVLATYAVTIWFLYSTIPYKTPWCVLNVAWPAQLLAGVTIARVTRRGPRWVTAALASALGLCLIIAARVSLVTFDNPREGYAYAATRRDVAQLVEPLRWLRRREPSARAEGVIVMSNPWPLPWLLQDLGEFTYAPKAADVPAECDADVLLIAKGKVPVIESRLRRAYYTRWVQVRQYQAPAKLYLSAAAFGARFAGQAPDFAPPGSEDRVAIHRK